MAKKPVKVSDPSGLCRRLVQARKNAGLRQGELAQQLGTSQASVNRWERGVAEPPLGALEKLAELSGKSIDWFLTGEEPEGVRGRGEPPHGYDLIRLPRGDPRRLSPLEADLLERALVVLRAEGESEHFAQSLMANISSFYRGVLQAGGPYSRQDEGGEKKAG